MSCGARMAGDLHAGTRKPVTIVFTDVADSTGLAERHVRERGHQGELKRRPVAVPQVRRGVLRVVEVNDRFGVAALD